MDLDQFETMDVIGRGARCVVYRARDTRSGTIAALKVLRDPDPEAPSDDPLCAEAAVLGSLPEGLGPRLIGKSGPRLAMELVPGRDLSGLGPVSPDHAADIAVRIAEALVTLHVSGFVHGDLTPQHILLYRSGPARLVDFGMAHPVGESPDVPEGGAGTPLYMAPESMAGTFGDPRSDLYAAGAVLYELLTGQPPFLGPDPGDGLAARATSAPPPPSRHMSRVPPVLDDLVLRLLQPDPEKRFPDATEFAEAARGLATHPDIERFRVADPQIHLRSPRLEGREKELDDLLRLVFEGRPATMVGLVIRGAPGAGKSRLLDETRRALEPHGIACAQVDLGQGDGDEPFSRDAINALRRRSLPGYPAVITVEGLGRATPDAVSSAAARLRSFTKTPLVLLIAAGPLATGGNRPESLIPPAARLLERTLPALKEISLQALVRSALGGDDLGSLFGQEIVRAARGNPGLAVAILHDLALSGVLTRAGGRWQLAKALPFSLVAGEHASRLLAESVRGESAGFQRLLAAVAILGEDARGETLQKVARLKTAEFEKGLRTALNGGLLREGPPYALISDVVSEKVQTHLDKKERAALHGYAAKALRNIKGFRARARLGHHLLLAGRRGDGAKVLIDACEQALDAGEREKTAAWIEWLGGPQGLSAAMSDRYRAVQEKLAAGPVARTDASPSEDPERLIARGMFREARQVLEKCGTAARPPSERVRLKLLEARACIGEGRLPTAEEILGGLLLHDSAADIPEARAVAQAMLGRIQFFRRDFKNGQRNFQRAVDRSEEENPGTIESRLWLARTLLERGDAAAALSEILHVRERAGRSQVPATAFRARALEAEALAGQGDPKRALLALGPVLAEARKHAPDLKGMLRFSVSRTLRLAGMYHRARRHATGAAVSFRKAKNGLAEVEALLHSALCAVQAGEADAAIADIEQAQSVFGRMPQGGARRLFLTLGALAELLRGNAAGASPSLATAMKSPGRPEDDPAGWAWLEAANAAAAFLEGDVAHGVGAAQRSLALLEGGAHSLEKAHVLTVLARFAGDDGLDSTEAAGKAAEFAGRAREIFEAARLGEASGSARVRQRRAKETATREERAPSSSRLERPPKPAPEKAGDTEWKQRVETLEVERYSLLTLARISKTINSELEMDRLIPLIMDMAVEAVKAERGFLLIERGDRLDVEVARTWDREEVGRPEFEVSRSIAEQVVRTGEAVLTDDAGADERFQDSVSVVGLRLRSLLCVPLRRKGRALGAVYVENRQSSGAFGPGDMEFLTAFADQAAVALENARLYAALQDKARQVEELNAELRRKVDRQAAELVELERRMEAERVRSKLRYDYENIVGDSAAMQEVFRLLDRITESAAPVHVSGESGTGKELVARAIHVNGPRGERSFAVENCAALSESLLESELFGHVKGAFTGAVSDRKGLFEIAHEGTLFLDEVGEMSPGLQAKLLRVLQDGEFRPVGGKETRKVDVRLITASNRDLRALVDEGEFRDDLFYRMNVIHVPLPPLRDRLDDIPLLVAHFLEEESAGERGPFTVDPEALKRLVAHEWPGNVRELQNEIKRAAALCDGVIRAEHLSPRVAGAPAETEPPPERGKLKEIVEALEKRLIRDALERHNANRTRAAEELGLSRYGLLKKMNRFGIE